MNDPTLADLLREAATLVEDHPDLPAPYIIASAWTHGPSVSVDWQLVIAPGLDDAGQKAALQRIIRAIGGRWDKIDYGDAMHFKRTHGSLSLDAYVKREAVCERVVTGTEMVTIPAKPAEPERTEEHDVVEWRCDPVMAEAAS